MKTPPFLQQQQGAPKPEIGLRLRARMVSGNAGFANLGRGRRPVQLKSMGVEKILTLEQAFEVVEDLKRRGKRVVCVAYKQ